VPFVGNSSAVVLRLACVLASSSGRGGRAGNGVLANNVGALPQSLQVSEAFARVGSGIGAQARGTTAEIQSLETELA